MVISKEGIEKRKRYILKEEKKTREKLIDDKERRKKKLQKLRLGYLEHAREAKQLELVREEERKANRHKYYFRHKLKMTFRLWWQRVKDIFSMKKIPKISPIEDIVVREVSKPYIIINLPSEESRLKKGVSFIEEEIAELSKPISKIEDDVRDKKKNIKNLLSPKIYNRTKELIRLSKEKERIADELSRIRSSKSL